MSSYYHACEGCGDPGVERDFRYCGSCAVLLEGIEDATVVPPARERQPGDDDVRPAKPKPRHDAKWLYAAVIKRGKVREAQAIGRRLRLHSNMLCWSADQVDQVVAALVAAKAPR